MSIRTTITLEEDVLTRLKEHSREKGISFRDAVNQVLREGLLAAQIPGGKTVLPPGRELGLRQGLSYDNVEDLLEIGEGPFHR